MLPIQWERWIECWWGWHQPMQMLNSMMCTWLENDVKWLWQCAPSFFGVWMASRCESCHCFLPGKLYFKFMNSWCQWCLATSPEKHPPNVMGQACIMQLCKVANWLCICGEDAVAREWQESHINLMEPRRESHHHQQQQQHVVIHVKCTIVVPSLSHQVSMVSEHLRGWQWFPSLTSYLKYGTSTPSSMR